MASLQRPVFRHPFLLACAAFGLLLLGLGMLLVSAEPSVPVQGPPTAQSVRAARDAVRQLKERESGRGSEVRLDNRTLEALAALASDFLGDARTSARVSSGVLKVEMSVPLPGPWWLNGSATIVGEHKGFPAASLRAGAISLPLFAGRRVAELARWVARAKGVRLPPLDEMVTKLTVEQENVVAAVRLPKKRRMFDALVAAGGSRADGRLVGEIYCALVESQRSEPVTQLPLLVRRAFGAAPPQDTEVYNRAAFVALAFYAVGNRAHALAPSAVKRTRDCGRAPVRVLLRERADLAKHWTFSAALQAVLGDNPASALGEWKELSDSLPSGSGFSFIDLAADRSGVRIARLGVEERSAGATAKRLAGATEEGLLPARVLAAEEGLPEAEFVDRFGTVEARNYKAAIAWIDRELSDSQR